MKNNGLMLMLSFLLLLCSCKSDLEKISINNIDAHRAYQDTIFNQSKNLEEKFSKLKTLITDYRKLGVEQKLEENINFNYYMARLYGKIGDFPIKSFWLDTVNKTFRNKDQYLLIYDSIYYYTRKVLDKDPDHIRAMYILCCAFNDEDKFSEKYKDYLPSAHKRDIEGYNYRLNYIINNASRFIDIDTTNDKNYSTLITYVGSVHIANYLSTIDYRLMLSDVNNCNLFYKYGMFYDYIKRYKKHLISKEYEAFVKSDIYPKIELVRKEFEKRNKIAEEEKRLQEQFADELKDIQGITCYRISRQNIDKWYLDKLGRSPFDSYTLNNVIFEGVLVKEDHVLPVYEIAYIYRPNKDWPECRHKLSFVLHDLYKKYSEEELGKMVGKKFIVYAPEVKYNPFKIEDFANCGLFATIDVFQGWKFIGTTSGLNIVEPERNPYFLK